jgi:hypothetical protein
MMKTLRHFCVIAALMLVLSTPILAWEGQMEFPLAAPPTPILSATASPGQQGETPNNGDASQAPDEAALDPLTEVALSLMHGVVLLF